MKLLGIDIRPIGLLLLTLGLAAILPSAAEATLRKCSNSTVGGGSQVPEKPPLVVDGVVVRDWVSNDDGPERITYTTPLGVVSIPTSQILHITVICLEHVVEGRRVEEGAIAIGTRGGAEQMMRWYLAGLAERQEAFRMTNGVYAFDLKNINFGLSRIPLPIELSVVDGGWSAVATSGGKSCRIAVGTPTATATGEADVECADLPTPAALSPAPNAPPAIHIRTGGTGL